MATEKQARTAKHDSALAVELRVVLGRLHRRLREQSHPGDFTSSQKSVLIRLERDGNATVAQLARAEGVRAQSMGATVTELMAMGHVAGTPDPGDGRRVLLSLTASCRKLIQQSRAAREDWLFKAIRAELTNAERDGLANAVEWMRRLSEAK